MFQIFLQIVFFSLFLSLYYIFSNILFRTFASICSHSRSIYLFIFCILDHDPIYECNHCCACDLYCINRVVQRGSPWSFEVIDTVDKGKGLISRNNIPKGSFVIEYIGIIITAEEAIHRFQQIQELASPCYVFALREYYGADKSKTYYIDATERGNVARLINHSCDANLKMVPVRTNHPEPHFTLFARRDISANEELTFSYGMINMNKQMKTKPCFCGSSTCAGFLPYEDHHSILQ